MDKRSLIPQIVDRSGNFQNDTSTLFIPISFHVFRDENDVFFGDTTWIAETAVLKALEALNTNFLSAKITFNLCTNIQYLDISTYYYQFKSEYEQELDDKNFLTPHTLNIYITEELIVDSTSICGYINMKDRSNKIFLTKDCLTYTSTLSHEVGHFLGLIHTHGNSEINKTKELVNATNCTTTGDFICDTPADPNLANKVNIFCEYNEIEYDQNNERYTPLIDNIMSYSRASCIHSFTKGQESAMRLNYYRFLENDLLCQDYKDIPESKVIAIYPNPFNNYLFLNYFLKENSTVSIALFDTSKRNILTVFSGKQKKGLIQHTIQLPNNLSKGLYYLEILISNSTLLIEKLVH